MLGSEWVYKNVFNFSDQEIENQRDQVAEDVKRTFRYTQIESGESDPEKYGFPQDKQPDTGEGMEGGDMMGGEMDVDAPEGGEPPVGEAQMGRPKTGPRYGQDAHPRGRDPLGFKERYKVIQSSAKKRNNPRKSPLSLEMMNSIDKKLGRNPTSTPRVITEQHTDPDAGTFLDLSNIDNDIIED